MLSVIPTTSVPFRDFEIIGVDASEGVIETAAFLTMMRSLRYDWLVKMQYQVD